MKSINRFNIAIERAEHLLKIYDLICDTRKYSVRKDWADQFADWMQWPRSKRIVRVDGKDRKSILIMHGDVGISREELTHDYLSELLRAAIVIAMSGLDRYMHDIVIDRSISLLRRNAEDIPNELTKIQIPILEAKRALDHLKNDPNSRPGNIVKESIREILHKKHSFQSPGDIKQATRMVGVKDIFGKISKTMPGRPAEQTITNRLKKLADRRNQIVHEADIYVKPRERKARVQEIKRTATEKDVQLIKDMVHAIDVVLQREV